MEFSKTKQQRNSSVGYKPGFGGKKQLSRDILSIIAPFEIIFTVIRSVYKALLYKIDANLS